MLWVGLLFVKKKHNTHRKNIYTVVDNFYIKKYNQNVFFMKYLSKYNLCIPFFFSKIAAHLWGHIYKRFQLLQDTEWNNLFNQERITFPSCKISLGDWAHSSDHKVADAHTITRTTINSVNVPCTALNSCLLSRLSHSAYFMIDYTFSQGKLLGHWGLGEKKNMQTLKCLKAFL